MTTDRSTKLLLAACALGLWANVALQVLPVRSAQAQGDAGKPAAKQIVDVNIAEVDGKPLLGGVPVMGTRPGRPLPVQVVPN